VADERHWDETVDVLVVGAGAAGMAAALFCVLRGLKVLVCEKASTVGGTTSTSAGTIWVPGTTQSVRAGVPDTIEAARAYLHSVIGSGIDPTVRDAVLAAGPAAIDELEARTEVKFAAATAHPDYLGNRPGAAYGGRALGALPFDGRLLGDDFKRVRPPRQEFMILRGMMVTKADIPALLHPFRSVRNFAHVSRMVLRYAGDRLRFRRGTRLVMGNALVARLLYSLRKAGGSIRFEAALTSLIEDKGRVAGAAILCNGKTLRIQARQAVVLATGGIGWNARLREALFPPEARGLSLAPESVQGDGLDAAVQVGAVISPSEQAGLWMPTSVMRRPDGTEATFPHIILDRAKPGLLAVGKDGRRFTNEADSYHDFVSAMLRHTSGGPHVPAYLICDRSFIRDYGVGLVHPGTRNLRPFINTGYLVEAGSLSELAHQIGVSATGLVASIEAYNGFAATGVDEEFGRGSTDLNRINGDPENKPNPCLRPIGPGPYYAVAVYPADLASSAGLVVDIDGRVLSDAGKPIEGLRACGNDAASIFAGTYPGPGTTLGPGLVMAYRIASSLSRPEVLS
jgi:3-oxosteroid 1-dehydrogenase